MFKKILIANRGEIALRVIRTCREMGVRTVAVYSDVDRTALHVRMADEAVRIGPPSPLQSYLRVEAILEAAQQTGAQAIHPGYGFLSERSHFAEAVEQAGLTFIGPPSKAMRAMGDKLSSRSAMIRAGVPVVPGLTEPVADLEAAKREGAKVGYPIALKAAGGGGGKGIRLVRDESELPTAFRTAIGEAKSAFGDARLYMERYLDHPRHIEVQIMGDRHGNVVALGERECSIQRRHQKLVEETPSVVLDAAMRAAIQEAAVQAAKAVGYTNAGTVEFLWSGGKFFFLEMNCRLQVEHPVTEMVYGVDLVREQLRVASGEKLGLRAGMKPRGHAIEVRINAEDPERNFVPSIGKVKNIRLPEGPFVRVDSGLYRGYEVTPFYDSLLAKIIAWGSDREQAIARLDRALCELHVGGVKTTAPLALRVLRDERFRKGDFDTHFLDGFRPKSDPLREEIVAIVAAVHRHLGTSRSAVAGGPAANASGVSPWVAALRSELRP
jgi:acetyl-CoA carboxylase biotin carboxylase subunit